MAKKQLFEYCILRHKVTKELKDRKEIETDIVQFPKFMLAKSTDEVSMKAAKNIPDELEEHLEEVEILCRPFCS